jgi:hypothetical protein
VEPDWTIGVPDSGGYPPWAFVSGAALFWPGWAQSLWLYAVLSAVTFAVLGKAFAVTQGLLPSSRLVQRTVGAVRTEWGLLVGLGLVVLGLAGSITLFSGWQSAGFGNLDPLRTLRLAIPSVLGLVLGAQVVMAGFFLDIMRLHLRARPSA